MRYFLIAVLSVCILTQPLAAQADDAPSLMERGAREFLERFLSDMEPALDSMRGFLDEMGPELADLMRQIEDWSVYEAPEILENGDIIIRRKPKTAPEQEQSPQVDL